MTFPVYLFVNTNCHEGKGLSRWMKIQEKVLQLFPNANVLFSENPAITKDRINELPLETETILISAGGDGAINMLINSLMDFPASKKANVILGAIGLGSSNDFLKPFSKFIGGIPARINIDKPAQRHDLVKVKFLDEHLKTKQKYFIINSSFGVTAQGNWNFNHPNSFLSWLKKVNSSLAINYTAVSTILSQRNIPCSVQLEGHLSNIAISNINILKNPYFSGTLYFDQAIGPSDGKIAINICRNMNKWELLKTLLQLENGKFQQNEKKVMAMSDYFRLKSKVPIIMECDGETEKIYEAEFSILQSELLVMQA